MMQQISHLVVTLEAQLEQSYRGADGQWLCDALY